MTETQEKVLKSIETLLTEHFDAAVLMAGANLDGNFEESVMFWHGGRHRALGMIQEQHLWLLNKKGANEPDNDGKTGSD